MNGTNLHHALGLHMHQPPGNLKLLLESSPREAEQILRCYERPARYAQAYRDSAHLHMGFSGVLLDQLLDSEVVDAYRHIIDIPQMLGCYGEATNVELVGMGYYHPIFPLIPKADWEEQLMRGRSIIERAFGRAPRGFWPPEMAFCMEMIPALVKAGCEYVVVDGIHVRPQDGLNDIYRPYLACHDGVCITVVPRDRDLSNAQENGTDPSRFVADVRRRAQDSPRPMERRLVTSWCDGENAGWFRQMPEELGFFGRFFAPLMERARVGEPGATPVTLSEYLDKYPPTSHTRVQTGSWSAGSTAGYAFSRWAGSEAQQKAAGVIQGLSRRYWDIKRRQGGLGEDGQQALTRARALILEAQTSCFLFRGDAWMPLLYKRTVRADRDLAQAEGHLRSSREAG
jgi:alpha-amylase/alpha-mannosidase (GH57 family)